MAARKHFFSRGIATSQFPTQVRIVEVGPRDGLQNERGLVSTPDKVEFIRLLSRAGCRYIEVGSFVSKKRVPAMANTSEVMNALSETEPGTRSIKSHATRYSCLVPTPRYMEDALKYPSVHEVAIFASASEAFSQANIQCSMDESLERYEQVIQQAQQHQIPVRGYLSCVIACPYQGFVSSGEVIRMTEALLQMGCYEVSLGDTVGMGTPATVDQMLTDLLQLSSVDTSKLAVHFHDTYGQALANILVSLEKGIQTVDSSVAGLGGCPYAKGATGNVATEDVIYMLDSYGIETGIDLTKLIEASRFICDVLQQPSRSRAGTAIEAKLQKP